MSTIPKRPKTKEAHKTLHFTGSMRLAGMPLITPLGIEQSAETLGKEGDGDSVPLPVPSSRPITGELAELLDLWESMTEAERVDLLAVARGLAASRA